eukprot:scaffold562_cov190-Ochromonas_danica.AAC.3
METSNARVSHFAEFSTSAVQDYLEQHFGPHKSKQEIIDALETCTILHRIPLPPPNVTVEQAHKDFKRERVLLNDVAFIPDRDDDDRAVAFGLTLRMLLKRLMRNHAVYLERFYGGPDKVADLLMQRACRTSAGADSFFTIQQMLCVEGTFVSQNTTVAEDPPIHIDVFLSDQANYNRASRNSTISTVTEESMLDEAPHLCARVLISNSFAIYDSSAMEEESFEDSFGCQEPQPWLDIDSIVVDESDLKTGEHWRKLHLVVTQCETGKVFSSVDDLSLAHPRPVLHGLTSLLAACTQSSNSSSTHKDDCSSGGNASAHTSLALSKDDQTRTIY